MKKYKILNRLIKKYAICYHNNKMRYGGHPEDIESVERKFEEAKNELWQFINKILGDNIDEL